MLVLAVVGGCVLPREMMPEQTQLLHAADSARLGAGCLPRIARRLGARIEPNAEIVFRACGVLAALGVASLSLASWLLRLD